MSGCDQPAQRKLIDHSDDELFALHVSGDRDALGVLWSRWDDCQPRKSKFKQEIRRKLKGEKGLKFSTDDVEELAARAWAKVAEKKQLADGVTFAQVLWTCLYD